MQWSIKKGTELTPRELYDLIKLRVEVFCVEQDCVYQDLDDQDLLDSVYHIQAFDPENSGITAYLRVMYNGEDTSEVRIGRVVVREDQRSTGQGRKLMNRALELITELQETLPRKSVMLHGQAHLRNWYESFGFNAVGDTFMEDGIPHLVLIKQL